jgi:hypothetical protein
MVDWLRRVPLAWGAVSTEDLAILELADDVRDAADLVIRYAGRQERVPSRHPGTAGAQ